MREMTTVTRAQALMSYETLSNIIVGISPIEYHIRILLELHGFRHEENTIKWRQQSIVAISLEIMMLQRYTLTANALLVLSELDPMGKGCNRKELGLSTLQTRPGSVYVCSESVITSSRVHHCVYQGLRKCYSVEISRRQITNEWYRNAREISVVQFRLLMIGTLRLSLNHGVTYADPLTKNLRALPINGTCSKAIDLAFEGRSSLPHSLCPQGAVNHSFSHKDFELLTRQLNSNTLNCRMIFS